MNVNGGKEMEQKPTNVNGGKKMEQNPTDEIQKGKKKKKKINKLVNVDEQN